MYIHFEANVTLSKGSEPAMMKKILCLLSALFFCAAFPAAAEESASQPVTAEELFSLLENIRTDALASAPLNDPAEENAQSEDGTLFQYEIARIYADGTQLTAETPVNVLVFDSCEGPVFRDTGLDFLTADLLAAFPLENGTLAGTRDEAVLYLRDTADNGFVYGQILRDGQRITAIEYGEVFPEAEHFRRTSITYSLTSGLVSSIRIDGLSPAAGQLDSSRAEEIKAELEELAGQDGYRMTPVSRNGQDLTPFSEDDLLFDGFSYTSLQPLDLPGSPESELIDNEDGTWLLRCDGDGYEAVFSCDAQGENAGILSFTILDEETEGPRNVRLGDLFSDDFSRFRSEENGMAEDLTEQLYGTPDTVPRGTANYDPDDMSLRYVTDTSAGLQVELLLKYENNILTEIILQTI